MRRPYALLFFTLLLAIGALPLVRMLGLPDWPINILLAFVLLGAGTAATGGYRRDLLVGLIVVIIAGRLAGQLFGFGAVFEEVSSVAWAVVALFAAGGALRFIFRRGVERSEQLYAALSAYLLVGIFMGVLYAAIGARSPEAFLVLGAPASPANFSLGTATYFSFVTLATLGYGDIVPASDAARGLAILEAVGGQLYLAVLVASLLGIRDTPSAPPPPRP